LQLCLTTLLSQNRGSNTGFIYNSESLHLFATASVMSSVVSRWRLEEHKISGSTQHNSGLKRLLTVFVITNAIAALCQLCGAVVIYSITLADSKSDTSLRQGILLVCRDRLLSYSLTCGQACTATQLLCLFTFCLAGIKRRIIEPFRAPTRRLPSTSIQVGNIEGAMRLDSF
jgi:hypothetical protein